MAHCSFDYMRAHGDLTVPAGGQMWQGGAESFLHRGQAGRWRELLTPDQASAYEARTALELDTDCAQWLAQGAGPDSR